MIAAGRDECPPPRKLLLVASTGGHLWELCKLEPRLGATRESLWITFDTVDSRSMLKDRRTLFIPYISPRDIRGIVKGVRPIRRALKSEAFDGLVSTGAAVAVSAMLAALGCVRSRLFVESYTRFRGPSLSGRLIASARLARTVTQHAGWSSSRWPHVGSILQDYRVDSRPGGPVQVKRVFVTVGTIRPFGFRRLLDRLAEIIPDTVEVTWQVGDTPGHGLRGTVVRHLDGRRFAHEVERADVVVTHAGIGTVLTLLDSGVFPVITPRTHAHHEHVDDHQLEAAEAFEENGLGLCRRVEDLTWADLELAAQKRVAPPG